MATLKLVIVQKKVYAGSCVRITTQKVDIYFLNLLTAHTDETENIKK